MQSVKNNGNVHINRRKRRPCKNNMSFLRSLLLYALFNHPDPSCPGPESSVPVSCRVACPISSQVTDHWVEPCNRTGEVHPVDPFHRLDNLKNHFAPIAFYRNSAVYNVRNGAVIELSFVVSIKGFLRH